MVAPSYSALDRTDRGVGWLFLLAGIVACGSVVAIPPQREVLELKEQLVHLHDQEAFQHLRVAQYEEVIAGVRGGEADLARRLISTQLHLIPADGEVVLIDQGVGASVPAWVEASLEARRPELAESTPDRSVLERLVTGPARLWLLAAGAVAIFVGILSPAQTTRDAAASSYQG